MPVKISQAASAEGVDLRNLQTMLCRARENTTRDKAVNEQIVGRLIDLRALYESIGYGSQQRIPATIDPAPPDLPVVVMPEGEETAKRRKAKNANGKPVAPPPRRTA